MSRVVSWAFLVLVGCAQASPGAAWPKLDKVVDEASGLVESRRWPGVFWTHNDSGDSPRIFAVSAEGALIREVQVLGASHVDWEDLTVDDQGHLWIADTGNNANDRRDLVVYRVPEPDPRGSGPAQADRVVAVRYPEQTAFPDPRATNFDAESLFWADGTLWLFTKHRSDLATVLYRFPALEGAVDLQRVARFELGGNPQRYGGSATAADVDPSGRYLALLTYHAVFLFERPEAGSSWVSRPVNQIALDQDVLQQCEGLAWSGGSLRIVNEDRVIFRVDDPLHARQFPPPPQGGRGPPP